MNKINGKARRSYVGDKVHIMMSKHTDINDIDYVAGTEYTPISSGFDNVRNATIQIANIEGNDVEFRF